MPNFGPIESRMPGKLKVWTIGHSNHPIDRFFELLKRHDIEAVADVRSVPYSRFARHFIREAFEKALKTVDVRYLFLGAELGGRPNLDEFYDSDGHVLYSRLAESSAFMIGIERLSNVAAEFRTAIMCSEEDPAVCHRHLLVSRVLVTRNVEIAHIRKSGEVQCYEVIEREVKSTKKHMSSLFGYSESEWKSPHATRAPQREPK